MVAEAAWVIGAAWAVCERLLARDDSAAVNGCAVAEPEELVVDTHVWVEGVIVNREDGTRFIEPSAGVTARRFR